MCQIILTSIQVKSAGLAKKITPNSWRPKVYDYNAVLLNKNKKLQQKKPHKVRLTPSFYPKFPVLFLTHRLL